jgi:putative tricarboxylic transport membrane protein
MLFAGFSTILNLQTILLIIGGVGVGLVFGAIPGLSAVMAVALCLPLTFGMNIVNGLSLLCGLYIGAVSGGLISAILLKIPGTPSSIATTFDGHPLALKGEAGKALGAGIVFSFLGGMFGILLLIFIAPTLAQLTIKFGFVEYLSVTIFSITMIAGLSKSIHKGLISGLTGFLLSFVGMAPIDSVQRFTFGNSQLLSGFAMLPLTIGVFAVSEVLDAAKAKHAVITKNEIVRYRIKGFGFSWREFTGQTGNAFRSALIGVGIGILPGIGGGISNILAYTTAKNRSTYPEKFGTGIIDGIVASESANNATVGGAFIPLLTLGIPGDSVTAVILGAFMLQGIQPSPLLFTTQGDLVYAVFAALIVAHITFFIVEFAGIGVFVKLLRVPKYILLPIVMALCAVGAFGVNNRVFDVISFSFFGLLGYMMSKIDLPLPPLILGFILGPNFELYLRRAIQSQRGDIFAFFSYPIANGFFIVTAIALFVMMRKNILAGKNRGKTIRVV